MLGGILYIAAPLQFALAQAVTAAAWNPPYNWLNNYISDLGNTACGMFAVPHAVPAFVCSPWHAVMNASFVLSGVLIIAGTASLWEFWPARQLTTYAQILWIISGVGKLAVGLVPENTNISLHVATAFNVPIGSAAILLSSVAAFGPRKELALIGLGLSLLGLAGAILSIATQFAGPVLLLGLGVGGMERMADYPTYIWLIVVGAIAVAEARGSRVK